MTSGPAPATAVGAVAGAPVSAGVRDWCALVLVVLARAYLGSAATLAAAALAPALWGWSGYVVRSGSMEPSISVGDVVVGRPMADGEAVTTGRVFVFADPASAEPDHLLVHRVVERRAGGRWTTAGDANADPDVAAVPRSAFRDRAVILVPYVALPATWWSERRLVPLVAAVAVTGAALAAAVLLRPRHAPGPGRRRDPDARHRTARRRPGRGASRHRPRASGWSLLVVTAVTAAVLAAGLAAGLGSASGGFSAATRSSGSTWSVKEAPSLPYTKAVLSDSPYVYYEVDEEGGALAADASGNDRTGSFAAVAGYRAPGALTDGASYAVDLGGGTGRLVAGGPALLDPTTFSLELWFRTSSGGGRLIGFESGRTGTSASFDRLVTMRTDGRLVYGDWDGGGQVRTIVSPASYDDGGWHHLVLTAVPRGSGQDAVLYVDGRPVASGTTSRIGYYQGWWRVGHGRVRTSTGGTAAAGFPGLVDQVAVYRTALPEARVDAHYRAR